MRYILYEDITYIIIPFSFLGYGCSCKERRDHQMGATNVDTILVVLG